MSTPSITVYVAGPLMPYHDTVKNTMATSTAGHMWYVMNDGLGNITSFGFAPEESGKFYGVGHVINNDNLIYQGYDYSRKIDVDSQQYQNLIDFGRSSENFGFNTNYSAATNSCVDFVWKALEVAGFNPLGFEGIALPTNNIIDLERIGTEYPPGQMRPPHGPPLPPGALEKQNKASLNVIARSNGWTDWLDKTINEWVNELYLLAKGFTLPRDPLMLDLDGDGLELKPADGSILFDHDADGIKTGTGWIGADDGILVRDLNGDGKITTGRELFGTETLKSNGQKAKDGFDALADLDSNHDGNFNAFVEALFRTAKYRPEYPKGGFADLSDARAWAMGFVHWYNLEHRHSGIGYVTPAQRHSGHPQAPS